jgi:integrase
MRPSESIALRWSRCDFRREQIRIDSARVRHQDKGTKTLVVRDVDLQGPALVALQRQRRLTGASGDIVFINPKSGKRIDDTGEPLQIWREALAKAGIRERDARQTRHTYATLGLHAGINPGYLSRQMGHKNAKMFFEVYLKWIDGAANQVEKDKMRRLLAECDDAEKSRQNCNPESHLGHAFGHTFT